MQEYIVSTILIVASSSDSLTLKDNKTMPTGYYLNELAVPALAFIAAGYDIVLATPNGNIPVMDERSNVVSHFDNDPAKLKAAYDFVTKHPSMQNPITLRDAYHQRDTFVAMHVPGGHAPITDLMQDPDLGHLLCAFHQTQKVTALLCHGPIALSAALPEAVAYRAALVKGDHDAAKAAAKDWPYAGYRMTIFSNAEEHEAEKHLPAKLQFYVADALTGAGGQVDNGPNFQPFVVQDRELITGQNPASDIGVAKAIIKALADKKL